MLNLYLTSRIVGLNIEWFNNSCASWISSTSKAPTDDQIWICHLQCDQCVIHQLIILSTCFWSPFSSAMSQKTKAFLSLIFLVITGPLFPCLVGLPGLRVLLFQNRRWCSTTVCIRLDSRFYFILFGILVFVMCSVHAWFQEANVRFSNNNTLYCSTGGMNEI